MQRASLTRLLSCASTFAQSTVCSGTVGATGIFSATRSLTGSSVTEVCFSNTRSYSTTLSEMASAVVETVAPSSKVSTQYKVVFVLGGPGSGKGTQCAKLVEEFSDVAHFSAGDLLREHIKSGTPDGNMVADMIKNGQIVPAEITVGLLQAAMAASGKSKILIDGFPRNDDNRAVFQRVAGFDCEKVLYFDCPEDVLEKRLLSRNQGRSDDNIETIKKRFKVFLEQSLPVIDHYGKLGKVAKIDTNRPVDDIYAEVRSVVTSI